MCKKKMLNFCIKCLKTFRMSVRTFCIVKQEISKPKKNSHKNQINLYFQDNPRLLSVKHLIPEKYIFSRLLKCPESLYLIDSDIAKQVVSYALPLDDNQLICDNNAGLGLITKELINKGVKFIRIYESCPEFKKILIDQLNETYFGRVELFCKDFFTLYRQDYLDKQDHGNRVEQLLEDLPQKSWHDSPVMTIFGVMSNSYFIHFLIKSLVLQNHIVNNGRFQIFAFMKPKDYIVLNATPICDLHTYQTWSILFNVFFDYEYLDKYPRKSFLPWESNREKKFFRYPGQIDRESLYLVKINFKPKLPLLTEYLLPFYYFVLQLYGRGTNRVIPTIEKWVPGSGFNVIIPTLKNSSFSKNIDIYTQFGELTPNQIVYVFREMVYHSGYHGSPFKAMIENEIMKSETINTSLEEQLEKNIEDFQMDK